MSAPTGADVAAFLGQPAAPAVVAIAEQHLQVVTAMARAYTRDRGFAADGTPAEDLRAVIVCATARLVGNPDQLPKDESVGGKSTAVRGAFVGWSLAETFVLNRYRRRAR